MITREELARQAEKSLRQGRVDEAIAHYQELAYLAPVDWNLVKQLADLLERTGQREGAARQFARWADHLFAEGFHSKAAALYKKVLKLDDHDEHALWQLGEVSLELNLRADARVAFQRVADLRHRRGDAPGAAAARDRLATLDALPVVSASLTTTPPAYASGRAASVTPAPAASADAVAPPPSFPASPVRDPVPEPRPEAGGPSPPEPAHQAPETIEARLARLRRDAEAADTEHAADADQRWMAVLDADPAAVAVRLRLVGAATDKGDLELAWQLAQSLDAAEVPALVVLVDLAHRRGRPDGVERLIAGRVHAGALPEHVLAPVHLLAAGHPAAARAALAAAVAAWTGAGQPGHAVAAIEQAEERGLLTMAMYLQWVEICVDAGLPELSRAQRALARAYLAECRTTEARAVAEDVFVRESGTARSRTLLLDVLERQGVADPERVLAALLTPPSDASAEGEVGGIVGPETTSTSLPEVIGESAAGDPEPSSAAVVAPCAIFDWSDLLGRDVDQWGAPPVDAFAVDLPSVTGPPPADPERPPMAEASATPISAPVPARLDPGGTAISDPEPIGVVRVEEDPDSPPDVEDMAAAALPDRSPDPHEPPEVTAISADGLSAFADAPARIGALRVQPLLAADAPLQPSFSMPRAWLDDTAEPSSAAAPRRRAPDDDVFDDDATPPRWAAPAVRAQAQVTAPGAFGHRVEHPPTPALAPPPASPGAVVSDSPVDAPIEVPVETTVPPLVVSAAVYADPVDPNPTPLETGTGTGASLGTVEEEVDLTQLLEELKRWDPVLPEPRARTRSASTDEPPAGMVLDFPPPVVAVAPPAEGVPIGAAPVADNRAPDDVRPDPTGVHGDGSAELDAVFADMQLRPDERTVAEQQLAAGRVFLAAGLASEAARAFERASREPRSRFEATLAIAELHKSRGQLLEAVSWYEQAATAPVPDAAVKGAVLYDLAESLEAIGETDRALGVLLDLLSQVEDYRDARVRLDRLLRVDAGG